MSIDNQDESNELHDELDNGMGEMLWLFLIRQYS